MRTPARPTQGRVTSAIEGIEGRSINSIHSLPGLISTAGVGGASRISTISGDGNRYPSCGSGESADGISNIAKRHEAHARLRGCRDENGTQPSFRV